MGHALSAEKISPEELILRQDGEPLFRIRRRTVFRGDDPIWEIAHGGTHLFEGSWQIVTFTDGLPLASFRYISSSYRYGEDLRIRCADPEEELLFRRVDPEQDRWLLMTRAGDLILETAAPAAAGLWELLLAGSLAESALWPVVCLLAFDRLASGRL